MPDSHYHTAFQEDLDDIGNSQGVALQQYPRSPSAKQADSTTTLYKSNPIIDEDSSSGNCHRVAHLTWWQTWKAWASEILAVLLALVALGAIVTTLAIHDGQTLPDWPFDISINTLVSVFSVVLKGSMLIPISHGISQLKWSRFLQPRPLEDLVRYDWASRGFWGSVNLLARLRGFVVSLGAIVMVVSIANDPFIQQVVKYRNCPQPSQTNATIARINSYYDFNSKHTGAQQATPGLPMQAALIKGVYGSVTPVEATRPTGNCTIPEFNTVAMCSHCEDISSRIDYSNQTECGWGLQLPSGVNLTLFEGNVLNLGPDNPHSVRFPYATNIFYFGNLSAAEHSSGGQPSVNDTAACSAWVDAIKPTALNCTLSPCVRTYSTYVHSGQTSEDLVSTTNMTYLSDEIADYSAIPMPCFMNGTVHDEFSLNASGKTYNHSWATATGGTGSTLNSIPPECYFNASLLALSQYLPAFLAGSAYFALEVDYADPAWVGQLYNDGNVSSDVISNVWTSIAESITVTMRQSADGLLNENGTEQSYAVGLADKMETCVAVDWRWLSLPAALIFITALFLIMTIVMSRNVVLLKESPLAFLVYGLEHDLRGRFHDANDPDTVAALAKKTKVQLDGRRSGGMRFVDVSYSRRNSI